ncbi:hypothetical protein syc0828_c [Synechococcus elongatus PCC 6301]|uniref:SAM-dependent chlorinase/fluorinase n=1 Tax=Synechococcus sp. (strain ATCC 27144 / PCC 6301 / SAUG 1402/1) TaxID=269084 RepID=A0A0H3K1D5_SYNP6|nr:SAM-dependent chlorinase/fluorinase [Synechococcus elongatus]BAD79018.1 hypothetical protein syc0828_c [Synechococcus elongatus PCC 6301]
MSRLLTLLTDFGSQDSYVGAMKGVIYSLCPQATLVDLCHEVPAQDVAAGRWQLLQAVPYFPAGSVHLAVVDPDVGSDRRAVVIETAIGLLIGPDNGLWSGVLSRFPAQRAVSLTNPNYWQSPQPDPTFHGRDIFAPAAAHLLNGVPLTELGPLIDPASLQTLIESHPQRSDQGWQGQIQAIDRFGNLITNLPAELGQTAAGLIWGDRWLPLARTYSEVAIGELLVLAGSHGYLEIAQRNGSAQQTLAANMGAVVRLVCGRAP